MDLLEFPKGSALMKDFQLFRIIANVNGKSDYIVKQTLELDGEGVSDMIGKLLDVWSLTLIITENPTSWHCTLRLSMSDFLEKGSAGKPP